MNDLISRDRYDNAMKSFADTFGSASDTHLYSAPGRTEIGGNHTDHQRGSVLAAAVDRDVMAVVRATGTGKVRLLSEGRNPVSVELGELERRSGSDPAALIRGVLRGMKDRGAEIGGFDAYVTSSVPVGAGLSSSAAFETLIGNIISGEFNGGNIDPVTIAKVGKYAENVYFKKPSGLMDQAACSVGNLVYMDFEDPEEPYIEQIDADFSGSGYSICITNTGGSHADLTEDYASVPREMCNVARLLGRDVLRDITAEKIMENMAMLRSKAGDRAVLRALHFVRENVRAREEAGALRSHDTDRFIRLVRESGDSSCKYLQNCAVNGSVRNQPILIALAASDTVLGYDEAARVHGGGFAGTIQAFVRKDNVERYKKTMDGIFGEGSCFILNVRKEGGIRII